MEDQTVDEPIAPKAQNFVVITKTHGEEREKGNEHIPANWPKHTETTETMGEAVEKYPGREVMSAEAYYHFSRGKDLAHQLLVPKKPWWKIW